MQPAYIISAYKRPDLLFRLVEALESAPISIHVDRKSKIWAEVKGRVGNYPNVTLLPRHVCHGGLFGHVQASIEGLKWFADTKSDYAVLLTGQCYPIKTKEFIERAIEGLDGRSLIESSAFPKAEWMSSANGGYSRIEHYYFKIPRRVWPRAFKPWKRRLPYNLHPYGGSSYWCLSREAVEYILEYIASHPKFVRYCKTTLIPDEFFFQTILGNSPLRETVISKLMHYTDWSKGGPNPALLTKNELSTVMKSDAWFARKFDDVETLNAIDAILRAPDTLEEAAIQAQSKIA